MGGGSPSPAPPVASTPPPPTMVDPAVIAARQHLIDRQSMSGRTGVVVPQSGPSGTLSAPALLSNSSPLGVAINSIPR